MSDWGWDGHMGTGGWLLMTLFLLLLVALIVGVVIVLVRSSGSRCSRCWRTGPAIAAWTVRPC